jgi:AraC family transcriptional regulator
VTRATYLPSCTLGVHAHREDRIILTASGEFDSQYGSRAFHLHPARSIYRPAQVDHRDRYFEKAVCISIRLAGNGCATRAFDFADVDLPGATRRLWAELDARDSASQLAIESLCAEIQARVSSRPASERARTRWICRVRDWLEESYTDPPALTTIAGEVDRDACHVATTFRKAYGRSIGDFVREVRIWRTRPLLEDTSIPLVEVAARGGFADQSHFTREFKRHFLTTPGEYRRRVHQALVTRSWVSGNPRSRRS